MLTNPRDALRGQSKSPIIVPSQMLGTVSSCAIVTLFLRRAVFTIFDFKKCRDLEIRVRRQGSEETRMMVLPDCWKKFKTGLNRLDTIPACDRRTDRQTDTLPSQRPRYAIRGAGKNAAVKTKQSVKQRLQRLLIRCSLCWGRRPHSPAAELRTGVETERLFLWCPAWWLWCVCQSPGLAQ